MISKTEVLASLDALNKTNLKEEIKGWLDESENDITISTKSGKNLKWYLVAAAAIVPLAISLFLILRQDKPTPNELFVSYFEPINNLVSTRSESDDLQLNKGILFYEQGAYDSAKYYLRQYEDKNSILIYLGISQLATDDTNESITTFQKIRDSKSNEALIEYANWFIALAYIKQGDNQKAKVLLEEFNQRPSSDYHEKAVNLLKDLDF